MEKPHTFQKIRNFLIDMDGTIYIGQRLLEGASAFWTAVNQNGRRGAFLTNNSARGPKDYVEKLSGMGIAASERQVFTSGDAALWHLSQHFPKGKVYLLGTPRLQAMLSAAGFSVVNHTNETPDVVLLGFDMTLTYEKIRQANAYIRRGIPFLATHPDLLCPAEGGAIPDTGTMIALFEAACGVSPLVLGKPCPPMAEAVLARYGFSPEETAMVGDRLYTDIAFANQNGMTAILVLSGETTMADYKAQSDVVADFIVPSVASLVEMLDK